MVAEWAVSLCGVAGIPVNIRIVSEGLPRYIRRLSDDECDLTGQIRYTLARTFNENWLIVGV